MINKPYSESCEQNKDTILAVLSHWFSKENSTILEIGSGTGQHACFFANHLKHLQWQPSDRAENIQGITAWVNEAQEKHADIKNLHQPLLLDVAQQPWPIIETDYVFSANTAHIMSWENVEAMFAGVRAILKPSGIFCLYGPFNYNGQFTSPSNAQFEQWLKSRDQKSGIRDFEALCKLGHIPSKYNPLILIDDHTMPANNRILVFQSQVQNK